MSIWRPTTNAKQVFSAAATPFTLIGIGLIIASQIIDPELIGSEGLAKNSELLITGVTLLLTPIIIGGCIFLWLRHGWRQATILTEDGISGVAKILDYEETGQTLNDAPKIRFSLEITSLNLEKYNLQFDEYVSLLYLGKLWIGKELSIKIDPKNHKNILINFASLKFDH
jgi:hypothetical protein